MVLVAKGQELEIAISPSPVGSGARAAGMADAFVAIADDATAASWNPAGLVQLESPEISIVGSYNSVFEQLSADWHEEVDSSHRVDNYDLNFLSVTYPLPRLVLGRNVSVGLYYQHKYDFSRDFLVRFNRSTVSNGIVLNTFSQLDFQQDGSLSTITPAVAFELTHRLSLGVALNFWRSSFLSDNSWEQTSRTRSFSQFASTYTWTMARSKEEYRDFTGENLTLGILWNVNEKWNVGARWDSAFTGDADFKAIGTSFRYNLTPGSTGGMPFSVQPTLTKEPRKIRFPETYAAGVAYRASDRLTLSFDLTTTDWNDFWFKGRDGQRISLVSADNFDKIWFPPRFERTYTARLGAEYVFVPKQPDEILGRIWTLRGGLYYDQEPASKEPDSFWGVTLGVGLLAKERVNLDFAYQLRYGDNVNADFIRGIPGFDEDVLQGRFLVSTVIYF
jgi:long-subunit fatty acid transport protein